MKSLIKLATKLLAVVALIAPLTIGQANAQNVSSLEEFETVVIVDSVNSVELVGNGQRYRYDSSLQVTGTNAQSSLGAIAQGDAVWLKGRILNNVFYIDIISVLPSDLDS